MGGSINVVLREEDGTVHKMCRWTNPLPFFVTNAKLFKKDPIYIQEYLKQWYDSVESGEHEEYYLTPTAGACAPYDYGLVVIDLKENIILDAQQYTSFNTINSGMLVFDLEDESIEELLIIEHSLLASIKDLADGGFISSINVNHYPETKGGSRRREEIPFKGKSFSDITDLLESFIPKYTRNDIVRMIEEMIVDEGTDGAVFIRDIDSWVLKENAEKLNEIFKAGEETVKATLDYIHIDVPFQIETFDDCNPDDCKRMKERILELGFTLDEKDESMWAEYLDRISK
ncbi:hypothetical protein [Neptuniibacter sp. QD37_11]|uniref:hypothetical protein n=1 Tax=Neptuniibacter sp. QD37_11 TaxID=3398209 RepID=UPI0039F5C15A